MHRALRVYATATFFYFYDRLVNLMYDYDDWPLIPLQLAVRKLFQDCCICE